MSPLQEEVVDMLAQLGFEREQLGEGATLSEDLGIDSTELVEIVVTAEKQFNIKIPEEVYTKLDTVDDLVNAIVNDIVKVNGKTAAAEG